MSAAFISLGANLADPLGQVERALTALQQLPASRLLACSPLYRSRPMGPADQPDYINGVALLETSLTPHQLLDETQRIELEQGRVRKAERWGPRTLDLDLLLFGDAVINDERLIVPHYGMKERAFVLLPLFDLAPDLVLPCGTALHTLMSVCDGAQLEKLTGSRAFSTP